MTTDQQIEIARQQLQSEYNRWLEFWCEKILPPVVFRWSNEGRHTAFIIRYCQRHGIKVVNSPRNIQLHCHGRTIAVFTIRFIT